jgi:UDPglucose 6-dehydrogenase
VIGYAGLTHLGAVSSIVAASKGYQVIGYDPDPVVCQGLNEGNPPFFEPGLAEMLAASQERIRFTHEPAALEQCNLIIFSLDVPTESSGRSDLLPLNDLIDSVLQVAAPDTVLVILSQIPPGFTRELADRINCRPGGHKFPLFHQVETLVIGVAVDRASKPERFIIGCNDPETALPEAYGDLLSVFDCTVLQMRYESAEVAKLAVNLFLASSVTMSNTLAELCEAIGGDWSEVAPALKLDKRIGPHAYLSPGLGLSGGHLERDLTTVASLATKWGTDAGAIHACTENSVHRKDWALKLIRSEILSQNSDSTIGIWGLAYKADTSSTTNSPASALIAALRVNSVRAYDPRAVLDSDGMANAVQTDTPLDACRGAHVLAIMTSWPEFSHVSLASVREAMQGNVIIDPFETLDHNKCEELGFTHFRLGSPRPSPVNAA